MVMFQAEFSQLMVNLKLARSPPLSPWEQIRNLKASLPFLLFRFNSKNSSSKNHVIYAIWYVCSSVRVGWVQRAPRFHPFGHLWRMAQGEEIKTIRGLAVR